MSDSQVIARKFRPQTFAQVVGQEAIRRTIENSIQSGRIHHAYLFAGARGVGKTTTARILAKALNCVHGPTTEPCGICHSCVEISASRSIDVMEIDAASNTGVENVRDVIINTVQISPARDRYKIFIIDEVHMLSNAAFNALLKTLEEPPKGVVFIMATTELHKVPETILSRCQVFEFRTISLKKITAQLRHIADDLSVQISDAALLAIARAGDGSMRDAESALDQVISFAGNTIADEDVSAALGLVDVETLNATMQAVGEQDASRILRIVDEIVARGYDLRNFCRELMTHIRGLLVVQVVGFDAELVQMAPGEGEALTRLAQMFSEQDLIRFFSILTKTEQDIRTSPQPRFQIEIGLLKLLQAGRLYLLEDALRQIADISSKLGGSNLSGIGSPNKGSTGPRLGGAAPFSRAGESKPSSFTSVRSIMSEAPISHPFQPSKSEPHPSPPITQTSEAMATPAVPVAEKAAPTAKRVEVSEASPFDLKANGAVVQQPAKPLAVRSAPVKPVLSQSIPPWEDEPPPVLDDPYDYEPQAPPSTEKAIPQDFQQTLVHELEARRRMILANTVGRAESVRIDGDTLRIVFSYENARDKREIEATDKRRTIEEICRACLHRSIKISVTVGANFDSDTESKKETKQLADNQEQVRNHPAVKAVTERFQGQILDIVRKDH